MPEADPSNPTSPPSPSDANPQRSAEQGRGLIGQIGAQVEKLFPDNDEQANRNISGVLAKLWQENGMTGLPKVVASAATATREAAEHLALKAADRVDDPGSPMVVTNTAEAARTHISESLHRLGELSRDAVGAVQRAAEPAMEQQNQNAAISNPRH